MVNLIVMSPPKLVSLASFLKLDLLHIFSDVVGFILVNKVIVSYLVGCYIIKGVSSNVYTVYILHFQPTTSNPYSV